MSMDHRTPHARHQESCGLARKAAEDGRFSEALNHVDRARNALDPHEQRASSAECEFVAALSHFGLEDIPEAQSCVRDADKLARTELADAYRADIDPEGQSDKRIEECHQLIDEIEKLIAAINTEDKRYRPDVRAATIRPEQPLSLDDLPAYAAFNEAVDVIQSHREMTPDEWQSARIAISNFVRATKEGEITVDRPLTVLAEGLMSFCNWKIDGSQRGRMRLAQLRLSLYDLGNLNCQEILIDCLFRANPSTGQNLRLRLALGRIVTQRFLGRIWGV